jgi:hypothetical protein
MLLAVRTLMGYGGLYAAPAPNIKTSDDDDDDGGFFSMLAGWTWHLIVAGVVLAALLFVILAALFVYRRRTWVKEKYDARRMPWRFVRCSRC